MSVAISALLCSGGVQTQEPIQAKTEATTDLKSGTFSFCEEGPAGE